MTPENARESLVLALLNQLVLDPRMPPQESTYPYPRKDLTRSKEQTDGKTQ